MSERIVIIDLEPILTDPDQNNWKSVARELGKGLHEIGAVYLVNHGVDLNLIDRVYSKSKELFDLPLETKRSYLKSTSLEDSSGYTEIGKEKLDEASKLEVRESYDIQVTNPKFPTEVPEFQEILSTTIGSMEKLKSQLFTLMALALDIDVEFFLNTCQYPTNKKLSNWTIMRVQKYPQIPEGTPIMEGVIRCASHTDWDVLTFLFQDSVGGLEMETRERIWVHVTPVPGSIVLNAGEILEIWTRGYFPAVVHRVLLSKEEQRHRKDRYSVGFFVFPDDNALVCPLGRNNILDNDYEYPKDITVRGHIEEHIAKARGS